MTLIVKYFCLPHHLIAISNAFKTLLSRIENCKEIKKIKKINSSYNKMIRISLIIQVETFREARINYRFTVQFMKF